MTTTVDVLSRPGDHVSGPPRTWLRFVGAFCLGVILCVGIAGGAILAYDAAYEGRVLVGVRVGETDLSGMDGSQAAAALAAAYGQWGNGRVVIHTIVAGDIVVPFSRFSRQPDVDSMIAAAMRTGRDGNPIERAVGEVRLALSGTELPPRLTLDETALVETIATELAALALEPVDATIAMTSHGIVWTPARPGRTFDAAPVQSAAVAATRLQDAPADVVLEAPPIVVQPARGNAVVLAAKAASERMIADVVVSLGEQTWTIPVATVAAWVGLATAADGTISPIVDEAAIPPALGATEKDVVRKPVSATFLIGRSGLIVGVKAGRDGRRLDVAATTADIVAELASRAGGAPPGAVAATVIAVEPEFTTAEAEKVAPTMVRLGKWRTWFPIGERNYWGANIWLPAKFINGTVLYPGQRFEWWSAVGPITRARGFGPGGVIKGDHTEPTGAIGGGMCSSSTTLFNAALRAGLDMGARSNHRYYIDRYPLGLDATVSASQTVSFTNDTGNPILIRGFKVVGKDGRGWVRYEIWGVPDGRTVKITDPRITNVLEPTTHEVEVTTLPTGVRVQTEWPMQGMDVSVTRIVRDRDGNVIHRDTYRSHYVRWDGRIEVGA